MRKNRLRISMVAILLLVVFMFTIMSAAAADKDSNAKHIAKEIEKHGVIIDGRLGIQDQNMEHINSKVGTVVSILNWTRCLSVVGTEVSIAPEIILTVSIPNVIVSDVDMQLAYEVAQLIRDVTPKLKTIKSKSGEMGILSSDCGYENTLVTNRSYDETRRTEYSQNVVLYPTSGSSTFQWTGGLSVSASAAIPSDIFSCSLNASAEYSISFTHNWGPASQPGYVCWPYRDAKYHCHEHVWARWYWYIDYPGGPKNYTYLGNDFSYSRNLIQNVWGQKEGPQ